MMSVYVGPLVKKVMHALAIHAQVALNPFQLVLHPFVTNAKTAFGMVCHATHVPGICPPHHQKKNVTGVANYAIMRTVSVIKNNPCQKAPHPRGFCMYSGF